MCRGNKCFKVRKKKTLNIKIRTRRTIENKVFFLKNLVQFFRFIWCMNNIDLKSITFTKVIFKNKVRMFQFNEILNKTVNYFENS